MFHFFPYFCCVVLFLNVCWISGSRVMDTPGRVRKFGFRRGGKISVTVSDTNNKATKHDFVSCFIDVKFSPVSAIVWFIFCRSSEELLRLEQKLFSLLPVTILIFLLSFLVLGGTFFCAGFESGCVVCLLFTDERDKKQTNIPCDFFFRFEGRPWKEAKTSFIKVLKKKK